MSCMPHPSSSAWHHPLKQCSPVTGKTFSPNHQSYLPPCVHAFHEIDMRRHRQDRCAHACNFANHEEECDPTSPVHLVAQHGCADLSSCVERQESKRYFVDKSERANPPLRDQVQEIGARHDAGEQVPGYERKPHAVKSGGNGVRRNRNHNKREGQQHVRQVVPNAGCVRVALELGSGEKVDGWLVVTRRGSVRGLGS